MTITSFSYLAFLAVVFTVYYLIRPKWQSGYLLAVSLVFYCLAGEGYTLLYLLVSTVSVYYAALAIHREENAGKARWILTGALLLNFGLLAGLKYYGFILWNVNAVRGWFGQGAVGGSVHIVASLGVSYYTLQLTGYLLDCYWKVGMVQTSLPKFALFACYFPQMTSGPVSRYKQVQAGLYGEHLFDYGQVTHGLKRMAWGLFKKMVVADRLGLIVDSVYGHYESSHLLLIWAGIFCFPYSCIRISRAAWTSFWGLRNVWGSGCRKISAILSLPPRFRNFGRGGI